MKIRTKEELVHYVNQGKKAKYLFFWGHKVKGKQITKSCFSQWYASPFTENGNRFATAEHYMMFGKAKLFGDHDAMYKALNAKNPGAVKAVGRSVRGFDQTVWNANKFDLVVKANLAKFTSNDDLREFLINTGKRVLVEASPVDRVWGIGMDQDDEAVTNPNLWKGENLLGFALMEVREQLGNLER
jgi:ribA/ribD-fused uncharacterized protein